MHFLLKLLTIQAFVALCQDFAALQTQAIILRKKIIIKRPTISGLFYGEFYEKIYDELNNYLIANLDHDNPEENMMLSLDWLDTSRYLPTCTLLKRRAFGHALHQLAALASIKDDTKCNLNSYHILIANDRATRARAHKNKYKLGPIRRVDKMVHFYFRSHALSCREHYPYILRDRLSQLDSRKVRIVEIISDGYVIGNLKRIERFRDDKHKNSVFWQPNDGVNLNEKLGHFSSHLIVTATSLHSIKLVQNPLRILKYLAREDPDSDVLEKVLDETRGKLVVKRKRIKSLFHRYIVEPCKYYVEELIDLHTAARYDHTMVNIIPEDKRLMIEFLLHRLNFQFCSTLINKTRSLMLKEIIKVISED